MRGPLIVLLFLICFAFTSSLGETVTDQWAEFKATYDKVYATPEEEVYRFNIFLKNLAIVAKLQEKDSLAQYGVTKFFDLTNVEFKQNHLSGVAFPSVDQQTEIVQSKSFSELPTTWDWRTKGVVGPVENEGQCGSTWAFAIVETFESVCAIAGYPLYDLSIQQLVDCDSQDYGCNGGYPITACEYIIKSGMENTSSYPYTGEGGACKYSASDVVACKLAECNYVTTTKNETAMQQFVYEHSPITVCVDASEWEFYTGGVITKASCGTTIDHCVELVGWTQISGVNAWILRNQWGSSWGDNGYVYIEMGQNVCGVASYAVAACVKSPSGKIVC